MQATAKTTKRRAYLTLAEAVEVIGSDEISYHTLRRLAVDRKEFTVLRDEVGRGWPVHLSRDEVEAYRDGRVYGLREFRAKHRKAKR